MLVALAAEANRGRGIGLFEVRSGALVLAEDIRTAAVYHERTRSDNAGNVGVTEAFQVFSEDAVFGLLEGQISPVEVVGHQGRFETPVERRRV